MNNVALILVICAAFAHASWNLLLKQIKISGTGVVWLFSLLTALIYFPINAYLFIENEVTFSGTTLLFLGGTFVLHMVYYLLLQQGYRFGGLSTIYPLARGTGPMLATLIAIVFLGEQPTALALLGAGLVVFGVFLLSGGVRFSEKGQAKKAIGFGLLTGTVIACYTIWDKVAVSVILISPFMLDYVGAIGRSLFLAPFALRNKSQLTQLWRDYKWHAIGIAILTPMAYILVLTAYQFSDVSYIAPAREMSTPIAVLMGVFLLKEDGLKQKLSASLIILFGIILLALN